MNLRQSWITINWNNKDATLKQVFDKIATPSFNLSNTDKNVYEEIGEVVASSYRNILRDIVVQVSLSSQTNLCDQIIDFICFDWLLQFSLVDSRPP